MKLRWILFFTALGIAAACCAALGIAYFNRPSTPIWLGIVAATAVSLEALLWVSAGVFGWGFLEKRRARFAALKARFFPPKRDFER